MPRYTFPDDGSAQHLAGVVVETSEEVADRIPGLKGGGAKAAPKAAPEEKTAAPRKTTTAKSAPKTGG